MRVGQPHLVSFRRRDRRRHRVQRAGRTPGLAQGYVMRRALLVVVLLVGGSLLAACTANHSAVDQTAGGRNGYVAGNGTSQTFAADKRSPAPDMTGELLDGGSYQLASQRGSVVVVNFWA